MREAIVGELLSDEEWDDLIGFGSNLEVERQAIAERSARKAAEAALAEAREALRPFNIGQLRHAYAQLAAGAGRDQKQFADGLIAPVIRALEAALTPKDQP